MIDETQPIIFEKRHLHKLSLNCFGIHKEIRTTAKALPDPVSLFADQLPRCLLPHDGGNASERDLRAMRVPFQSIRAVDLSTVFVDQGALDP